MSTAAAKMQEPRDVKCQTCTDSLCRVKFVQKGKILKWQRHLVTGFNSKEVLIANTQVWYKWMWTYRPSIWPVPWLLTCPDTAPGQGSTATGRNPPPGTSRAALQRESRAPSPHCLPERKGWEQCRSQDDDLRVFMLWKCSFSPPDHPTAVVPGTYSVQSHRLVFRKLNLGKSLCSTCLPQCASFVSDSPGSHLPIASPLSS